MMIHNRLVAMKLDTDRWTSVLEPVSAQCNLSKHESTEMKPIEGNTEYRKITNMVELT